MAWIFHCIYNNFYLSALLVAAGDNGEERTVCFAYLQKSARRFVAGWLTGWNDRIVRWRWGGDRVERWRRRRRLIRGSHVTLFREGIIIFICNRPANCTRFSRFHFLSFIQVSTHRGINIRVKQQQVNVNRVRMAMECSSPILIIHYPVSY